MKETITNLVDNKDGGPADVERTMTLDGVRMHWDFNETNNAKFDKALKPWLDCAEVRGGAKASTNGTSVTDVRTWAAENGYEVSSRGRISAALQQAYDEAHA